MQESEFIGKLSDFQIHEEDSGHGLSWLRGCMVFLNPSMQIPVYYLESVHEHSFRIICSSVFAIIQAFNTMQSELLAASLIKLLVQILRMPCSMKLFDESL
jgi:hypothetical protein